MNFKKIADTSFKEFYVETRLPNISKTTNVTNFTDVILKSYNSSISYIQIENTKTTRLLFKGTFVHFDIQNDITLAIFLEKLQNHTF